MPPSPNLLRRLVRLGVDVRRIDSQEQALEILLTRLDQQDQAMPPMRDNLMQGYDNPRGQGYDQVQTPQYPMNEDGTPMFVDAEGKPMTQDEYVQAVEAENEELRKMLEGQAEDQAMSEYGPMADEMGIEVGKKDSALDVAIKIASKILGPDLHEDTSPDFVSGVIEKHKADTADETERRDAGREAGRKVWKQARADSQKPERRQARERRHDSIRGGNEVERNDHYVPVGPAQIASSQYRNMFRQRRDGGRR